MGCGASQPEAPSGGGGGGAASESAVQRRPVQDDPAEMAKSSGIDRELDRARQQEELKVKLLLLGAGESGKSTIFKQMRILYGSQRSDDDLRMYGVVIRSNVITAMRKLCGLLRSLEMEGQLAEDPAPEEGGMTPKGAYELIVAHLIDNTGNPDDLETPNGDSKDWVGNVARAGLGANNDAKQFLQLWKPIKILWDVSSDALPCAALARVRFDWLVACLRLQWVVAFPFILHENDETIMACFSPISSHSLPVPAYLSAHPRFSQTLVQDHERSMVKTCSSERNRRSQRVFARPN
jgi:G-protein alpha subunit